MKSSDDAFADLYKKFVLQLLIKKIKCSQRIRGVVFRLSLLLKSNSFSSLVLSHNEIYKRRGKYQTEKQLNVNQRFFVYVICLFCC